MDEQNVAHNPSGNQGDQASASLNSLRQAAYEQAYYQAASQVPWAADQVAEAQQTTAGQASPGAGQGATQAASAQEASSFAEYVSSDAFQPAFGGQSASRQPQQAYQAQQVPPPQAQQAQPFVDNAYQQPWNTAADPYGQSSAAQGGSGYEHTYAYQKAYNQARYGQPQQQQQQTYRPYVASKDHVAAGLLAIFLGSLGIHKFYLGYNTAGFIMLGVTILGSIFTLGIAGAVMGVISLIEGIIYLTKSQGAFDAEYVYGQKEWF